MSTTGTLFVLPVPISPDKAERYFAPYNAEVIKSLTHFIAEDAKTARRNLKFFGYESISNAHIELLNEHSKKNETQFLLKPLLEGNHVGLMSDAGCPGIADPGAEVIRLAHQKGIKVQPLSGPSSIVLSIMASGFNGQNFAFVGYLPIDSAQRNKRIKELEHLAKTQHQAQYFIETPYRNTAMFESLLQQLSSNSLLLLAKNIGHELEDIRVNSIEQWKKMNLPDLHKQPVVFGIYSNT